MCVAQQKFAKFQQFSSRNWALGFFNLRRDKFHPTYAFTMDDSFSFLPSPSRSLRAQHVRHFRGVHVHLTIMQLNFQFGYVWWNWMEQVKFFVLSEWIGTHCDDFSSFKRLCFSSLFSDYWLPIETIAVYPWASFSSFQFTEKP